MGTGWHSSKALIATAVVGRGIRSIPPSLSK
jgi:hypothetical protein